MKTSTIKVFNSEYLVVEDPDSIIKSSNLYCRIWSSTFILHTLLLRIYRAKKFSSFLEIGCGLGILTCEAAKLFKSADAATKKAKVYGFDFVAEAILLSKANAKLQGVDVAEFFQFNWHNQVKGSLLEELGRFDLIIASDCLYMSNSIGSIARLVQDCLSSSGLFILVDPGRGYEQEFLDKISSMDGLKSKLLVLDGDRLARMLTLSKETLIANGEETKIQGDMIRANVIFVWSGPDLEKEGLISYGIL